MGGEIHVESEKNKGSRISFILNLKKGNTSDLPLKDMTSIDTQILSGKRILVVDDNEMNRVVATTVLNNYGAITIEALNGKESVEKLAYGPIDLVLMDIQMPVMDGIEATKLIRKEISETLPIIALTANAIKGDNEKYFSVGMNDYISKPFSENDLIKICAIWLGKKLHLINTMKDQNTVQQNAENLYDLSYLHEISRGDEEFIKKMIGLFVEQIPGYNVLLNEAHQKNDMGAVKSIAHRTKSSIDTLLVSSLQPVIKEIEMLGLNNQPGPKLDALIQKMNETLPKVIEQLKVLL